MAEEMMAEIVDLAAVRRSRAGDDPVRDVADLLRRAARQLDQDGAALRRQAEALAGILRRLDTRQAAMAEEAERARAIGRQAAMIGQAIESGDIEALEALREELERLRAAVVPRPGAGGTG